MTVERTRQIFGKKMDNWTDKQVSQFIGNFSIICDELLKTAVKELTNQNNFDNTDNKRL